MFTARWAVVLSFAACLARADEWEGSRLQHRTVWGVSWIARVAPDGRIIELKADSALGEPTALPAWSGQGMLGDAALSWPTLDLKEVEARQGPAGTMLVLRRRVQGIPVFDQQVRVLIDATGHVRYVRAQVHGEAKPDSAWNVPRALEVALRQVRGDGYADPKVVGAPRLGWGGSPLESCVEVAVQASKPRIVRRILRVAGDGDSVLADLDLIHWLTPIAGQVFDPNPIASENLPGLTDTSPIPPAAYYPYQIDANDPVGGRYSLQGPYVRIVDRDAPTIAPVTSNVADGFMFTRGQPGFDQFNAYFWASVSAEYVDSLGFTLDNWPLDIDAQCDSSDGPHYVPHVSELFGDESPFICLCTSMPAAGIVVDAAEDADVITHEHMHSIIDGLRGTDFTGDGETGAIHEGSGDYWAASWGYDSSSSSGFDPACIAEWFVAGVLPCLRSVDSGAHYPEDVGHPAQADEHHDGEIWSQFLWDLAGRITDFTTVDTILLQAILDCGAWPSFYELADAMMTADQLIYGGTHRSEIAAAMTARGLFPRPPEVSSSNSSFPLLMAKLGGGDFVIAWEDFGPGADGYNVYEGDLDAAPSHSATNSLCSPAFARPVPGWDAIVFSTGPGNFYYVVTAHRGGVEGPCCRIWLPIQGEVQEWGADHDSCGP